MIFSALAGMHACAYLMDMENDVTNKMSFFDQVARKLKLPKAKSGAHHEQKSGTSWHAFFFFLLMSPLDPFALQT